MNIKEEAIKALREAAEKLFNIKIIDQPDVFHLADIEKAMSKAKGSKDARDLVALYTNRMKISIKTELVIDAGKWHSYVLFTEPLNMLVVYKSRWLTNFGRMFTGKDEEGTGLNRVLAQFAVDNFVDALVIVRPDKTAHYVMIKDIIDYAELHKTVRAYEGMEELHIPITMLKPFPPHALRGKEATA